MQALLLIFHVLLAIGLIVLILLQHGKGADAGAAFGSGASSTVFGARGSTSFLTRTTAVLATLFFITSLSLAYLSSRTPEQRSVTEQIESVPATVQPEPAGELPVKQAPPSDLPDLPPDNN
jgi:protein translocase, SecG subunit